LHQRKKQLSPAKRSSEFDVTPETKAEAVSTISGVFISGLDSLKKRLGAE